MKVLFFCCLMTVFWSCSKDPVDTLSGEEGPCTIALALKPDYTLTEVGLTRSAARPSLDDFRVRLENTRAEVLRSWAYAELPHLITVVPGSYKLVAWYGSDTVMPAFDKPYYYGETKITLKEGDNLDTVVQASVATVKVAVTFDESFGFDYDDYFVDIKTVGDSLRFLKEEMREGYFLPGKLRMRFGLKPKGSDTWYQFYPEAIASVKAKQFYRMTLKAQSKNGALSSITITTDSSTIEIPVNVDLPPFYLPKAAPVVSFSATDMEGGSILTTEGVSKKAVAMITSEAGLTALKLRTTSDTLLQRGWPAEIDLMKATAAQKALLKANGLNWKEEIDTQDTINASVWVNFTDVVKLLNTAQGQTAGSGFEIEAVDKFGQRGNECAFQVNVAPPVFGFVNLPGEGNVFAKRVMYDVNYDSEVRTPVVECRGADGEWVALATELQEIAPGEYACVGKGLAPVTDYAFRVRLGGHVLDAGSYTTEQVLSVPNANMDSWYLETQKNWLSQRTYIYHTCTSGESSPWWANNNVRSTWWTTAPVEQNSAPAVSYLTERSGKVAEIRSTGSGSGYANTSSICYDGSRIPGMLFIGDYHYDKPDETISYGRPFAARPLQLKFWYHYTPYNNEEFEAYIEVQNRNGASVKVLGSGVLRSSAATADYVQACIGVNYTDKSVRATHMYIRFLSSTASQPAVEKNVSINLEGIKNGWKAHVGSRLKIDDIELVYE